MTMPAEPVQSCNGRRLAQGEPALAADDRGVTLGWGVFETLRAAEGRLWFWPWHWERLQHSARLLSLPVPPENDARAALADVWAALDHQPARLRYTLTAGRGPRFQAPTLETLTRLAFAEPLVENTAPARVIRAPQPAPLSPLAGAKTTSYGPGIWAIRQARAAGADEIIWADDAGRLIEGAFSNLFVVTGTTLRTPRLKGRGLAGITRRALLALAPRLGLAVEETDLAWSDFLHADEAFLTTATRGPWSIIQAEAHCFPAPGPWTDRLRQAWLASGGELF